MDDEETDAPGSPKNLLCPHCGVNLHGITPERLEREIYAYPVEVELLSRALVRCPGCSALSEHSIEETMTDEDQETDVLGFFKNRRCPHCNAAFYKSEGGRAICLNACDLPVWQYRKMQAGLAEARLATEGGDKQ